MGGGGGGVRRVSHLIVNAGGLRGLGLGGGVAGWGGGGAVDLVTI